MAIGHLVEGSPTTSRILTVRTDGTGLREFHRFTGSHWPDTLRWTPDGQSILFVVVSIGDEAWRMMRIPANGGVAEFDGLDSATFTGELPSPPPLRWGINRFDISPDGLHVVAGVRTVPTFDLWTIDNIMSSLQGR